MRARAAPGLHRRLDVDDCRERLVVDDDGLGAVLGGGLGLGDDERDGLTGEDDLLARERLGGAVGAGRRDREVGRGEHGDDTRNREGRLLVDATDPRMSLGREDGSRVQQAVDVAVGGEARRAGHLVGRVDARPRDADQRVAHASSFARSRAIGERALGDDCGELAPVLHGCEAVAVDLGLGDRRIAGRRPGGRTASRRLP